MDSTEVMDAQIFLVKTTEPQDVTTKKRHYSGNGACREEETARMGERQEMTEREIRMYYRYV